MIDAGSPLGLLALAVFGLVAGVVNTLAGGGSLLTLPALIFAGLSPAEANATNRLGVLAGSVSAIAGFEKEGMEGTRPETLEVVSAVAGALAGAQIAAWLDPELFRRVIAVVMLLMLGVLLLKPKTWMEGRAHAAPTPWRALGFFAIGAYGGFLQAGVGLFLLAGFVWLSGRPLHLANGRKVVLVALFTVPALALFAWQGLVHWLPGLAMAVGATAGGWLGARFTMAWGPAAIRWLLIAVVVVSSARLWLTA